MPEHTYKYSFSAKDFVRTSDGRAVTVAGAAALSQALEKLLQTRRYAYAVYDNRYGSDLLAGMAAAPNDEALPYVARHHAMEVLLSHPKVVTVRSVEVLPAGPGVRVTATVVDTSGSVVEVDTIVGADV